MERDTVHNKSVKNSLTISNNQRVCNVPFNEILYIKSNGMCSSVYTTSGEKHCISKNLGVLEKQLNNEKQFLRVHNSCIINIMLIKEYLKQDGGTIIMQDGEKIIPSKRKKQSFLKVFKHK